MQGVDVGSPVKFRGVPIGRVSAINFTFNEYGAPSQVNRFNYVRILMEIDREMFPGMFKENLTSLIETNVAQGLRARIEPQGVTGINYIEINYVNDPSQFPSLAIDWKPHSYYIPSAPGQLTNMLDSDQQHHASDRAAQLRRNEQVSAKELLENLNKAVTGADIEKTQRGPADVAGRIPECTQCGKCRSAERRCAAADRGPREIQCSTSNHPQEPRACGAKRSAIRAIMENLATASANFIQFSVEVKTGRHCCFGVVRLKPKATPTPRRRR